MRRITALALLVALIGAACSDGDTASPDEAPTTTLHPFYEAFPELIDFDPGPEPGLACPDGGGVHAESDVSPSRERSDGNSPAAVEFVVGLLERTAGPERAEGLRRWLNHSGSSVFLSLGPDQPPRQYALRIRLEQLDGDYHTVGMEACDFPFEPIPPAPSTFYDAFPEAEDAEWVGERIVCPKTHAGSGGEDNELDLERARASFADDPESKADDAVDAVVRRLEAGGADPDRLDGLRRWLRHVGDHVVLRVGPDDIADRYLLRATMSHVDGAFYLIESITSCNFLWEPIPEP